MITKIEIFENYEIHYTDYDHYMDFKIYVIVGYGKSAKTDEFCIPLYGDNLSVKRDDNDTFLEGGIKWDSCSNWDFQTHESLMHFCGKKDAMSIGRLMEKLYDLAATISKFDKEIAK